MIRRASADDLVQLICAMRLLMHDSGLVLSTRESAELRDNLLPLGITQMSAGDIFGAFVKPIGIGAIAISGLTITRISRPAWIAKQRSTPSKPVAISSSFSSRLTYVSNISRRAPGRAPLTASAAVTRNVSG